VALPGYLAAAAVPSSRGDQVQPAGVDIRVGAVLRFLGRGRLGVEARSLPRVEPVEPEDGVWRLERGVYKVVFADPVYVPSSAVGLCFPRSSLLRSGVLMACAVWDPGYYGRGEALLEVANPHGFELEVGARVAQIVFVPVQGVAGVYRGRYLGENLGGGPGG